MTNQTNLSKYFLILLTAFVISASASAGRSIGEYPCSGAIAMELGQVLRGHLGESTTRETIFVSILKPGILSLDASLSQPSLANAKLSFLGRDCGQAVPNDFSYLEITPTHRMIAIHAPGDYFFSLEAQEDRTPLGDYKISVGFTAIALSEALPVEIPTRYVVRSVVADDEVDPDPKSVVADDEVDPDPKALTSLSRSVVADDEVDPDPKSVVADDEVDPDPKALTSLSRSVVADDEVDPDPKSVVAARQRLCDQISGDDHGDIFSCASPLALDTIVEGALANGSGDDSDLFEVELDQPATLRLEVAAEIEIFAELYDEAGQRLTRNLSTGNSLGLIRALGPGRYFLRIAPTTSWEGSYALIASAEYN